MSEGAQISTSVLTSVFTGGFCYSQSFEQPRIGTASENPNRHIATGTKPDTHHSRLEHPPLGSECSCKRGFSPLGKPGLGVEDGCLNQLGKG